ncbi:MAG: hypothetical protein A2086_00065 [Spirochaetes bacterium GWD1_27_9]|nr:MAG: hypothetical protein A2Z98_17590 [Spirochaetes bacterium GWB1_27_13]OHD21839.1 MAG: hypothetical protein A2Y34_12520 [Spirochaetes bacterium GWC1_27_15]OHD30034.1 MAG: hypothetical protein A2086_00065 [Spirochaetes bacterium GWD1_27_9]
MNNYIQIQVTFPDIDTTQKITNNLLNERLVSCVQILPILSKYWWENKIVTTNEYICFMKTKQSLFENIKIKILSAHPYKVPEIIVTPILEGNKDYLAWIDEETC